MDKSKETKHCKIGGAFYCAYLRQTIGIIVELDDNDAPIGFNCDFQICGNTYCKVFKEYPIGVKPVYPLQKNTHDDSDDA